MIKLDGVHKAYGKNTILHGVNLEIAQGEFLVIVGASGCGKSTLLRLIAGLETPTQGDIYFDQRQVTHVSPADRDIAMVFQNYALYPHMTVRQNIAYSLKIRGANKNTTQQKVAEIANMLQLNTLLDRKPKDLSGGQRQRVAMGRALVRQPKVFLFDEPLSNLDASLRTQMRIEIKRLHQKLGITSVYVTHDQVEAMTMATRLVVMNQGHVEQMGTPRQLHQKPVNQFVASFIGSPAMNFLQATVDSSGQQAIINDQWSISLPIDLTTNANQRLQLGIRPEHLQLGDHGQGIPMTVELAEELGVTTLVHGHLEQGEQPLRVSLAGYSDYQTGERLWLQAPADQWHIFDEQGRRLN